MGYSDRSPPERLVRVIVRALISRVPSYASISFNAKQALRAPSIARLPPFISNGDAVAPASLVILAGPVSATIVWAFPRVQPEQAEDVAGTEDEEEI